MTSLTPLKTCLAQALAECAAVASNQVALDDCTYGTLAEPLYLGHDLPRQAEALRSGYGVNALEMLGASADMPLPLGAAELLQPADPLPLGCDAILAPDAAEHGPDGPSALRAPAPGEGIRRMGHDARAGLLLAPAGTPITPRLCLLAALAGKTTLALRRPRLRVQVQDTDQARFLRLWAGQCGAKIVDTNPDLILATTPDHSARLAFTPAETAWMSHAQGALVLHLPRRFDGMVAAILGLGVPALAALAGASPRVQMRTLSQKISSVIGLSELVLLAEDGARVAPFASGAVTLTQLAQSHAFAIIPPDSEGLPAGAGLPCISLDQPFG